MTAVGDESVGAGLGGHMRASHADREGVIDTLKAAFVQGRLTKDELDLRVGLTFVSRTYGELGMLTADLPVRLIHEQRAVEPVVADLAHPPVNKPLMWGTFVATLGGLALIIGALPAGLFMLLVAGVFTTLLAAPVAGTLMLDSLRARRSGGQPPSATSRSQAAIEGLQDDGRSGDGLTLVEVGRDDRKSAANPGASPRGTWRPLTAWC